MIHIHGVTTSYVYHLRVICNGAESVILCHQPSRPHLPS
jgi:hypothetical protein